MEKKKKVAILGESKNKLRKSLISINLVLEKYGGRYFENLIFENLQIVSKITWDGFDSFEGNNVTNSLQNLIKYLKKSESILSREDYERVESFFEILELSIVEIKMAYCD